MKIYLAAPIFTPDQLKVVEKVKGYFEEAGHELFSPYHNSQDIWRGRAPADCSPSERELVLEDNITNIDWCEILFAWVGGMGGFTDPGVVWEMGYAHAKRKFTVAYLDESDERVSMNLMLAGTVDAVVKGEFALSMLISQLPVDKLTLIARDYHPDKLVAHEREPIV